MELELVPREGEKLLSPEEREQMMRRIRVIEPEELAHFTENERQRIKIFLFKLIALSEHVHHDMEDEEHVIEHMDNIEKLHEQRRKLFKSVDERVDEFIHLVDLCAAEPWLEFEVFMHRLVNVARKRYYETKHSGGVEATLDNPFLMQMDEDLEDEKYDLETDTRMTERDIEALIFRFTLEELVANLINARKMITGQFWDDEYYDL
jgi:hypothetical protein